VNRWFIAVNSFTPAHKDWKTYLEQSGLNSVKEIISIDQVLCAPAIRRFEAEDWKHNVQEHLFNDYFLDLDYLIKRTKGLENVHVLSVVRNPDKEIRDDFQDVNFRFLGYDLTDHYGSASALTNCGPLPLAFTHRDLSSYGLIYTYKRAAEVREALQRFYAEEFSQSLMWGIWQRIS
jgi:hypothetical protein